MSRRALERRSGHASRSARRAGYTLIEVMMAVAIMTGGAVGLMSLQRASIAGNAEARQMTTATEVVSTWLERLQRDSIRWTAGGPGVTFAPALLLNTEYLRLVPDRATLPTWIRPTPADANESWGFDHWGRDTRVVTEMEYCANVRLQWVYMSQAMRADVRVWYARRGPTANRVGLDGCAPAADPNTLTNRLRDLHMVYGSTVVRWNPLSTTTGTGFGGGAP